MIKLTKTFNECLKLYGLMYKCKSLETLIREKISSDMKPVNMLTDDEIIKLVQFFGLVFEYDSHTKSYVELGVRENNDLSIWSIYQSILKYKKNNTAPLTNCETYALAEVNNYYHSNYCYYEFFVNSRGNISFDERMMKTIRNSKPIDKNSKILDTCVPGIFARKNSPYALKRGRKVVQSDYVMRTKIRVVMLDECQQEPNSNNNQQLASNLNNNQNQMQDSKQMNPYATQVNSKPVNSYTTQVNYNNQVNSYATSADCNNRANPYATPVNYNNLMQQNYEIWLQKMYEWQVYWDQMRTIDPDYYNQQYPLWVDAYHMWEKYWNQQFMIMNCQQPAMQQMNCQQPAMQQMNCQQPVTNNQQVAESNQQNPYAYLPNDDNGDVEMNTVDESPPPPQQNKEVANNMTVDNAINPEDQDIINHIYERIDKVVEKILPSNSERRHTTDRIGTYLELKRLYSCPLEKVGVDKVHDILCERINQFGKRSQERGWCDLSKRMRNAITEDGHLRAFFEVIKVKNMMNLNFVRPDYQEVKEPSPEFLQYLQDRYNKYFERHPEYRDEGIKAGLLVL